MEGQIEGRPAGSAPGYSGDKGVRTTGVGSGVGGEPGHDSGGDVDTNFIGFGASGAIAAKAASPDELTGADATDGSRDKFASGGPAAGRNTIKAGTHGASPSFTGDVVDHSGEDKSTNNSAAAGSVKPVGGQGDDPGSEGEITMTRRPATSTKGRRCDRNGRATLTRPADVIGGPCSFGSGLLKQPRQWVRWVQLGLLRSRSYCSTNGICSAPSRTASGARPDPRPSSNAAARRTRRFTFTTPTVYSAVNT